MTLQSRLDAIREASRGRIPPEARTVMERHIEQLRASGSVDRIVRAGRLPIPARLVIDRQGIIRSVDADPDYTRRPEPARTVEMLRSLPKAASR